VKLHHHQNDDQHEEENNNKTRQTMTPLLSLSAAVDGNDVHDDNDDNDDNVDNVDGATTIKRNTMTAAVPCILPNSVF
jgi:hypothetical protein